MRYEARVYVGKTRYGKSPVNQFCPSDRPFGVWDNYANQWWKGNATARAGYKTYESAEERARTLNSGEFKSQGKPTMYRHQVASNHFARLVWRQRVTSDWAPVNDEIVVSKGGWRESRYYDRDWIRGYNLDTESWELFLRENDGDRFEVEEYWIGEDGQQSSWRIMPLADWVAERRGALDAVESERAGEELNKLYDDGVTLQIY